MKYKYLIFFSVLLNFVYCQNSSSWCGFERYFNQLKLSYPNLIDTLNKNSLDNVAFKTSAVDPDHFIWIPVVFHVVHDGITPAQNITDAQILSQISILNSCFLNSNSHPLGSNVKVQFCLAKTGPFNNATNGITRTITSYSQFYIDTYSYGNQRGFLTSLDKWPSEQYLNIWVANTIQEVNINNTYVLQDLAGQASIPIPSYNFSDDGIIMNYKYVGNIGTATIPGFTQGKTLVHEVGHWLGLFHTFQPEPDQITMCNNTVCNNDGDRVCDTEPVIGPAVSDAYNSTDPTKRYDCDQNIVSAENYMEYNLNQYLNFFTSDQKDRMRFYLKTYRSYFYDNSLNNPTILAIECSAPGPGTGGQYTGCNNQKFPDEWLRMNGNEGNYVELCEGIKPVFNANYNGKCLNFPNFEVTSDCPGSGFNGNCPLSVNNFQCTSICRLLGSCECFQFKKRVFLSIWRNCNDNFNCGQEIKRWFIYSDNVTPNSFNVADLLNYDLFAGLNGDQNKKFIIKIATMDENGTFRSGQKYLTYIQNDLSFPLFIPANSQNAGYAPAQRKAINTITFFSGVKIPPNSLYIAGEEIALKEEAHTVGLIESHFKIDLVTCSSNSARLSDSADSKQPIIKSTASKNETISNNQIAEYFGQSKLNTTLLENDIFLSPNPSSGIFNLIIPKQIIEPMDINIYNSSLQYMKTIPSKGVIDIQSYPNGIYFIEFIINGYKTVRKAVKV